MTRTDKAPLRGRFFLRVAAVLLPLAYLMPEHYPPWLSFHSELLAGAAVLCAGAAIWIHSARRSIELPLSWSVGVFAVACHIATSYLLGHTSYLGDALVVAMYLAVFGLCIALGYQADQAGAWTSHWFWCAIVLAGLASGLIGSIQWAFGTSDISFFVLESGAGSRAVGNLAQANHLGTLCLIATAAALLLYQQKQIGLGTLVLTGVFLSFGVAASQSRTALLAASLMAAYLVFARSSGRIQVKSALSISWLAGIIALAWLVHLVNKATGASGSSAARVPDSTDGRFLILVQSFEAISHAPLFGFGWNSMAQAQRTAAPLSPGSIQYISSHNIGVDAAVFVGLPLALLACAAVIWWAISAHRSRVDEPGVLCVAAIIPFATHAMLEFPHYYLYFLAPIGYCIGKIERLRRAATITLSANAFGVFVLALTLTGIAVARDYLLIEEDFRVIRFNDLRIGRQPEGYETPRLLVLTQMGTMLRAAHVQVRAGMPAEDIAVLKAANQRFAYNALAIRLVAALGLAGQHADARRELELIQSVYGHSARGRANQALKEQYWQRHPELWPLLE